MPSKTNSDRILDLEKSPASLEERLDNLRRDVERIEKVLEGRADRRWSLMIAFLGILGSAFVVLLPELLKFLRSQMIP